MTLTDASPLVALLDKNDGGHAKCVETALCLPPGPFLSTWPCFTEAMHLLFRASGYSGQDRLWQLFESEKLLLHDLQPAEISRMRTLMEKYRDTPMDLADASLVIVAERLGLRRIFTLDSDFRIYRLADGSALEVVP